MTDREAQRACNNLVMQLNMIRPMDNRERRIDFVYGVYLSASFISPIFILPGLFTFGHYALGLGIVAVVYAIALAVGLSRRRRIISSFYTVPDAEQLIELTEADEALLQSTERDERSISIRGEAHPRILVFLYNWFVNRRLLQSGSILKVTRAITSSGEEFILVPVSQLSIESGDDERFGAEAIQLGAELL